MPILEINPRYRDFLAEQGLRTVEDFLALPGLVVGGHPDRNVARVTLGAGASVLAAFLKCEHRVPWKDRLLNARAGFGLVSKSVREARVLGALTAAGMGCPDWLAVGEDARGHAFLLVRDLGDAVDLRLFMGGLAEAPAGVRRHFAQRLGQALARLHNAGFDHPDLYAKHILVRPGDRAICFLDCQRSCLRPFVPWKQRCRELAALAATLSEELVPDSERVWCLRAYLRACRVQGTAGCPSVLQAAYRILREQKRLLRQRRIRELRQPALTTGTQSVVWQNGEALCLTPAFQADLAGQVPDWLDLARLPPSPRNFCTQAPVSLPSGRRGSLVCRREHRPLRGIWTWLHGRRPTSPEIGQAGLLFRLERYGVPTPRLLAFGQRQVLPGRIESFLLTEPLAETISLTRWLSTRVPGAQIPGGFGERRQLLGAAAEVVRRLHEAGCYIESSQRSAEGSACALHVRQAPGEPPEVVVAELDSLRMRRGARANLARRDLRVLRLRFLGCGVRRTEQLRFLLRYLNVSRLTPAGKRLARAVLRSGAVAGGKRASASFSRWERAAL